MNEEPGLFHALSDTISRATDLVQLVARRRKVVRRLNAIDADTAPARAVLKCLEKALAVARDSN